MSGTGESATGGRDADPGRELERAVAGILDAGVPGALLSVQSRRWSTRFPGGTLQAVAGDAQTFGDDGPLRRPLTSDVAFDLASVSKVAGTVTMLASLVSAGRLALGDPVARYLPDALPGTPTVSDLLTHRSGLAEWWPTYLSGEDPFDVIAGLPLWHRPGSGRFYSDLGFMLLGRLVETVTGSSLPQALADLVTGPVAITELRYAAPPPGIEAAATGRGDAGEQRMIATGEPYPVAGDPSDFSGWRRHVLVGEVHDGNAFHSFGGAAGHAGLFGTVGALHRLGSAWLDSLAGDGPWPALSQFVTPSPEPGQLQGFRSWDDSLSGTAGSGAGACTVTAIGHPGFTGMGLAVIPRHQAVVVLATNRVHVDGRAPAEFAPLWTAALAAAHLALHTGGAR